MATAIQTEETPKIAPAGSVGTVARSDDSISDSEKNRNEKVDPEFAEYQREITLEKIKMETRWNDRSEMPSITKVGSSSALSYLVFGPLPAVAAGAFTAAGALKNVRKHNSTSDELILKAYDISKNNQAELTNAQIDELMGKFDQSREKNHQSRKAEALRRDVAFGALGGVAGGGLGFFKGLLDEGISFGGAKKGALAFGLVGMLGLATAFFLGPLAPLALLLPVISAAVGAVVGAFGGAIGKSIKYAGAGAITGGLGSRILKGNKDNPERAQFRATLMAAGKRGVQDSKGQPSKVQKNNALNAGAEAHRRADHVGEAPKQQQAAPAKPLSDIEALAHEIYDFAKGKVREGALENHAAISGLSEEFIKISKSKFPPEIVKEAVYGALISKEVLYEFKDEDNKTHSNVNKKPGAINKIITIIQTVQNKRKTIAPAVKPVDASVAADGSTKDNTAKSGILDTAAGALTGLAAHHAEAISKAGAIVGSADALGTAQLAEMQAQLKKGVKVELTVNGKPPKTQQGVTV